MTAPEDLQPETPWVEIPFGHPHEATPAEPSPSATATVTWIGRYRVERRLGEGGFGAVYLALDEELNRRVAIKVPKRLSSSQLVEYREEAQKLAKIEHPGVVPIHDIGHTTEFPVFLVTKFIEGGTLSEWVQRARPDFLTVSRLIAEVAEALHATHLKGIFHRDIKPANILVDATGKPYLADFGLALTEGHGLDAAPEILGTPAYMSPEQAAGEGHRVDGQTDIFSLGVVLYELLAGVRPFRASEKLSPRERTSQLLEFVKTFDPRQPRQVNDHVPKELERIETLEPLRPLAIPKLQSMVMDPQAKLLHRLHAAYALAAFGDTSVKPALIDAILDNVPMADGAEAKNMVVALRQIASASTLGEPGGVSPKIAERIQALDLSDEAMRSERLTIKVRYAALALYLGDPSLVAPMLQLGPDPTERTAFTLRLKDWPADLSAVREILKTTNEESLRSGMVAALGRFPKDSIADFDSLSSVLQELFVTAPDGGSHSASDWTLRQWGVALPDLKSQIRTAPAPLVHQLRRHDVCRNPHRQASTCLTRIQRKQNRRESIRSRTHAAGVSQQSRTDGGSVPRVRQ